MSTCTGSTTSAGSLGRLARPPSHTNMSKLPPVPGEQSSTNTLRCAWPVSKSWWRVAMRRAWRVVPSTAMDAGVLSCPPNQCHTDKSRSWCDRHTSWLSW